MSTEVSSLGLLLRRVVQDWASTIGFGWGGGGGCSVVIWRERERGEIGKVRVCESLVLDWILK
ncbi:hypothetical protein HanRHA438_Chr07g0292421 [Helianthus annuus]|nr:hypothetical protein HanRHA438_Chr07g0292421 [Helianthus annuus]